MQSFDKKEFLRICKIWFLIVSVIILIFACYIIIGIAIFGVHRINHWSYSFNLWMLNSTKISYMQPMFQLGAATSIAFAVAGPQIQHALGPRIVGAVQSAKVAMHKPNAPVSTIKPLIRNLQHYDKYKRELVAYTRSNLYPSHLFIAYSNIILLFWSSLIDPRGEIQNQWAVLVVILSIMFPLTDLIDAFIEAHHIRPILQEAKDACNSGISERVAAVCQAVNAEIKPLPTDI